MAIFNPHTVYILKLENDSFDSGLTNDIDAVVRKVPGSTLVFQQHFDDMEQALEFESRLKTLSDHKKAALINGDLKIP